VIDPHWQLVDLDPYTWRAIGRFIDPSMYIRAGSPDERGLYVIHDRGRLLSAVESSGRVRRDLGIVQVDAPRVLAGQLFARGEWDRVHVIDRQHLSAVATQAQQLPNRDLNLDAYYQNVFRLIWGDGDGYVSLPPHPGHWNGWTYERIAQFIGQLREPSTLALGVVSVETGALEIGLIGEVSEGTIRKVTTFEALPFDRSQVAVDREFLDQLWSVLSAGDFAPAAALLCTDTVFERWIYGSNKAATIDEAIDSGQAVLRVREAPPLIW
jgi:hypothetical protein